MSATDRDAAYAVFLGGDQMGTWSDCLEAYAALVDGREGVKESRPNDIWHALTIGIYVAWLHGRHGELERQAATNRRMESFCARVGEATPFPGPAGVLIEALMAATAGYSSTAGAALSELRGPTPMEVVVLTMPSSPTARAATLKPFALPAAGAPFLPALYFYCSSLLDLGYQSDASALLDRYRQRESSFLRDARGQLFELAGAFDAARAEYDGSPWASHVYRRAICDLILGAPVESLIEWDDDVSNRFRIGMLDFSSETDRAGVVRSASFVRACRFSGFDNWLIHFELGRLGFQRRRHAEAEKHLAAAARSAPERYCHPIRFLRFTNLTWLREALDVEMTPEAIEAGLAAIRSPAPDTQGSIRTWLGAFRDHSAVLDPLLESDDNYDRGRAHDIRDDKPGAIASWCAGVGNAYSPRTLFKLIDVFASSGFERTASRLADIVLLESYDAFFDLWELAYAIAEVMNTQPPTRFSEGLLEVRLSRVETRLEELVQSEFQNAIRAFDYFLEQNRPSQWRRMLARAEKLAEGSEENLLLAVARRKAASGGWDPAAIDAIRRADRQAHDRLERLIIARELVTLGQLGRARAILVEEGVFSRLDLTPIEYVLALQAAKLCAGHEERAALERTARETLQRDASAGAFESSKRFLDRLNENLSLEQLELPLRETGDTHDPERSDWSKVLRELEELELSQRNELQLLKLSHKLDELARTDSPFSRLALWRLHFDRFEAQLGMIERLRPRVAETDTPLARDPSLTRSRAERLARLWQAHFAQTDPARAEQALRNVRGFFADERRLETEWKRLRAIAAEQPLKSALRYATEGAALLEDIRSNEESSSHFPAFLGIRHHTMGDAKELAARLQERVASAGGRVRP